MELFTAILPTALRRPLRIALVFILTAYLLRQFRKPSRWVGRPFLWMMNQRHSKLTDWGLQHVQVGKDFTILDVGCGGGRTIQKLAAVATEGKVCGADYAPGSVTASRANNLPSITTGRVSLVQASVSALPFSENCFDLVTAVETQYFWPNLLNDMKEIRRVLKPRGTLVIIAEEYKTGKGHSAHDVVLKFLGTGVLSPEGHSQLFASAGFADIQIFENHDRGWICVTGKKDEL